MWLYWLKWLKIKSMNSDEKDKTLKILKQKENDIKFAVTCGMEKKNTIISS
jgi:hypothetical protein